ncbi:hypothetical protein BFG48_003450, partial [Acinetobacter nosocomialis]
KYIINPENERKFNSQIKVRVLVDNEMPLETLEVLMTYISTLANNPTLTLLEDKELNNFITFNCKPDATEEIIEKIRDFASLNNIEIQSIRKSIFPNKVIS